MHLSKAYSVCCDINAVQLNILAYGHADMNVNWQGTAVSPMFSRLYYILDGDPYILKDGERISLEVGKCYILPTGYSYYYACETTMEQIYFHINLDDFAGKDLLRFANGVMEYTPDKTVFSELLSYVGSEELFDGLKLRQIVYTSVLTMLEKYNVPLITPKYSECVKLAIEYIKGHLSLNLGIAELAAHSFVSQSTLAKKFRTEVGVTIGRYIDDAIMFEAEQLLRSTNMSVLVISERYGFCDQFYFSRQFKKKYGKSPQKYRKLRVI